MVSPHLFHDRMEGVFPLTSVTSEPRSPLDPFLVFLGTGFQQRERSNQCEQEWRRITVPRGEQGCTANTGRKMSTFYQQDVEIH